MSCSLLCFILYTSHQDQQVSVHFVYVYIRCVYPSVCVCIYGCTSVGMGMSYAYMIETVYSFFGAVTVIWSFGLWKALLVLTFPIAFTKNSINVIQLVQASQAIAEHDMEERAKKE